MAKCLITGGAGFIGSHLARALVKAGHEVTILDNLSTGSLQNLGSEKDAIRCLTADIRARHTLHSVMRHQDYVWHLAAIASVSQSLADPALTHDVNATGTLNILLAAARSGIQRLVYASTAAVYGASSIPCTESQTLTPASPYGATKQIGEIYCRLLSALKQLPTTVLRYFNVYGPGQSAASPYSGVIPLFIQQALTRQPATIYGTGQQQRDFVYIDDVVAATIAAVLSPSLDSATYNIASGYSVSINDLHRLIQRQLHASLPPRFAPARTHETAASAARTEAARDDLHFTAAVPLAKGLARTVAWHQAAARLTV